MTPVEFEYVDDEDESPEEEELDEDEMEEDEETEEDLEEEVEVIETVFDDQHIDDLIEMLEELKESKTSIVFGLDETTEVVIHHEEDPELNDDEENE